jgi:glycosyltransferase involved in cell wall biosynthesis
MEIIEGVREWRFHQPDLKVYPFLKSTFVHCRSLFYDLQKKFSFDIVNFHQPFTALGVLSSKAARGIPRVYTCHSLSFEEFASRSSSPQNRKERASYQLQLVGRKLAEKALLGKSNRIVVLSEYTREKILKKYGLAESKIEIIPGAVNLAQFSVSENKAAIRRRLAIPENRFVLLTIRNLVPRMGLENLIMAFQLVVEKRNDILLTVGGEGPLAEKLQDMARDAGMDNLVRFARNCLVTIRWLTFSFSPPKT